MKSVFSLTLLETPLQYTLWQSRSSIYIFLDIAFHMYGPAQYIFFASTIYLFGDHISPRSQLYWEQQ